MTQVAIELPVDTTAKKTAPKKVAKKTAAKKATIKPKRKAVTAPKGWTIEQEEALLGAINQDSGNMQKEFLKYSKQLKKEGTPRTQGSVQAKFYELVSPGSKRNQKGGKATPKLDKPYAYKKAVTPRKKKKKSPGVTLGNARSAAAAKQAGEVRGELRVDIKSFHIRNNQIIFTY